MSKDIKINNRKWFYFIILFIFIAGIIAFFIYFYFNIYLQPNFSNKSLNFVSSNGKDTVKPGDRITYTINFENSGFRTVDELEIIAKIPDHTEFISASGEGKFSQGENKLVFIVEEGLKSGDKGSVDFTVKVERPLDNETPVILDDVIYNYRIKEKSYSEIIQSNLNHKVESSPQFGSFDLQAIDENGGYLRLDDVIGYTIKIENTGDMNATGVKVRSTLTDNVIIDENSITVNGKIENGYVIWNIDKLDIDNPRFLSFKVKVKNNLSDQESIINNISIVCDQGINKEESIEKKVSLFPDLSNSEVFLYDLNGGYLWAGETIRVKVVLKNDGEKVAESYRLICPIPAGATYISRSGTPEGIRWSDEIRGLVWELENLEVGSEKVITFDIKVNENLLYKGGTIATNFKIESEGKEIELVSKSITIKRRVSMTVVAMGDSLIAKSDWVQRFDNLLESTYPYADYNTIASGIPAERAYQGYWRFDNTVAPYHPEIIIIAYGSNDAGCGLWNFRDNLDALVLKSKRLGATVFINLIGPIVGSRWSGKQSYPEYNDAIRQIAAKYGVPVIDVLTPLSQDTNRYLSDGLHYTPEGAAVVAQTVYSVVTQYLDDVGGRR